MADHRSVAQRQGSRQPLPLVAGRHVADRVDTAMELVQTAQPDPSRHRCVDEARLPELSSGYGSMLTAGDLRNLPISGAFISHIDTKVPGCADSPPEPDVGAGPKVHPARNPWAPQSAILQPASRLGPGFSLVTASFQQ